MTALVGRWHELARLLEHEAALSRDNAIAGEEDAEVLSKAAAIMRRRGDNATEAHEAERHKRFKDWDRRS
jgi:hypothetical protein